MIRQVILILLVAISSAKAQEGTGKSDLSAFHYLVGKWVIEEEKRSIYEEWEVVNNSVMSSVNYYVQNGDTSYTEKVELKKEAEGIFYVPTVEHNAEPVLFKLTSMVEGKAVFENPEHDFPTRIIYEKINNDSLHASIEGTVEGRLKVIEYPFKRVK